ncbi:MAG TPA: CheR family methyltransferase [Polyangia bacterium]|jgi:chemotaxis protein methyltransferase CheR
MTASVALSPAGVDRLRALALKRLGLRFDEGKSGFLGEVLQRRLDATGRRVDDYLFGLEGVDPSLDELRLLAQELTVTETYFFRNIEQLRAFSDVVLTGGAPGRPHAPLSILSAGCASGEEAYSLAMLVQAHPTASLNQVDIQAMDINTAMLKRAQRGRYSAWALRETPSDIQARCFRAEGRDFVLDERFRSMVTFAERNLIQDDSTFWRPDAFDVVFCRNVLMYFPSEVASQVVARIARSLRPGGFLFLGYAETLRGLSQEFHLLHTHGTFYYQRRHESERVVHDSALTEPSAWAMRDRPGDGALGSISPLPAADLSWVETIRRASERVASLTTASTHPPGDAQMAAGIENPPAPARRAWDLGLAIDLMRQEKFKDALALVNELPAEAANDADVLLLRAVLLTHGGDLAAAEAMCAEVLRLDELSAGAHYLMALCREGAGDRAGATDQDQVAAYLDPSFAMPRLHMGLLARRGGEQATARRELKEALRLLQGEEASRLLLFAGGFTRDALLALCRAELKASGGAP